MLKTFLVLLALGLSTEAGARSSHTTYNRTRDAQVEAMQYMASALPDDAEISAEWQDCGMINAFYFPWDSHIVLCNESIYNSPGHAVFEAAHEMGHALVDKRGLPVDGDPKAEERAADELAALALIEMGKLDELQAAGMYYRSQISEYVPADDPHPDYETRAWEIMCLGDGAEDGNPECVMLLSLVRARWALAFALTME